MKIKIINIGPIHKFEIDLSKKLTMIYGKNNIGKSYAISVVYMILKALPNQENRNEIKHKIVEITGRMNLDQPLHDNIRLALTIFLHENFSERFNSYLRASYGKYEYLVNQFTKGLPSIELVMKKMTIQYLISEASYNTGKGITCFAKLDEVVPQANYTPKNLQDECINFIGAFIDEISKYNSNYHYLPAVKTGIYQGLGNIGTIIAKINPYSDRLDDRGFDIPRMTIPVSDFYLKLSSAKTIELTKETSNVLKKIEDKILSGRMEYDTKTGKIYYLSQEFELPLEIFQISSMVAEVGLFTVYLKYLLRTYHFNPINPNSGEKTLVSSPVVFFEEPEAHVHPETQIKLMELLVKLAKTGTQIVLTTHSDYMLNSLTNQILALKIRADETGSILIEKKARGAEISKKMVAKGDGIEDHNFFVATDKLYRDRIDLNEKYYERVNRGN